VKALPNASSGRSNDQPFSPFDTHCLDFRFRLPDWRDCCPYTTYYGLRTPILRDGRRIVSWGNIL